MLDAKKVHSEQRNETSERVEIDQREGFGMKMNAQHVLSARHIWAKN